jgi:hypothetical protein
MIRARLSKVLSIPTKVSALAKSAERKTSVDREALAIILAFTVLGGTLALAQSSKEQTTNSANVHAKNLDRCPYYPSPVFCHSISRSREQNEIGDNGDGR